MLQSLATSPDLSTWVGLAHLLGFPPSVLPSTFGGGILYGLAWLDIGYYLTKQ